MATLYCTFSKSVGWRMFGVEQHITDPVIRVVMFQGRKCLSIPVIESPVKGQFCNPKKLTLSYVREFGRYGKHCGSYLRNQNAMEHRAHLFPLVHKVDVPYRPHLH